METIAPHANHTFTYIESDGQPHRPLDFPPPQVRRGVRVNALVVHPATGQRDILPGVIHRESYTTENRSNSNTSVTSHSHTTESSSAAGMATGSGTGRANNTSSATGSASGSSASRKKGSTTGSVQTSNHKSTDTTRNKSKRKQEYTAYFPQRRLQDAIYGSVWACLVLKRHYGPAADDAARAAGLSPGDPGAPFVWEIVGTHVAIKMVEWIKVNESRGRLLEDPVKEVAAMQLIGMEHPNVLGSQEVLQDDDYLFSIMPFAKGGDLFGYVVRDTELRGGEGGMTEPVARYWFKQILEVSTNQYHIIR